jgi:DNA-directed RNA polymerase subunit beta'
LAEASLKGSRDKLVGLKENVIIGRLIPVDAPRATSVENPKVDEVAAVVI